jgi:hypothetical protein
MEYVKYVKTIIYTDNKVVLATSEDDIQGKESI